MPRFCANLTMLYNEHGFLGRFAAAAADGFTGRRVHVPLCVPEGRPCRGAGAERADQVLHNLPAGNWEAGERGIACLPDRVGEFQEGVGHAVEYARALRCPQLNCLVGLNARGGGCGSRATDPCRKLALRGRRARASGHPPPRGARELERHPRLPSRPRGKGRCRPGRSRLAECFLQFDFYHQQRMDGELLATYRRLKDRIVHIQIADNPGRKSLAPERSTTPSSSRPSTARVRGLDRLRIQTEDHDLGRAWLAAEYLRTTVSAN